MLYGINSLLLPRLSLKSLPKKLWRNFIVLTEIWTINTNKLIVECLVRQNRGVNPMSQAFKIRISRTNHNPVM